MWSQKNKYINQKDFPQPSINTPPEVRVVFLQCIPKIQELFSLHRGIQHYVSYVKALGSNIKNFMEKR